jgi:5-methyltetrahydrofolate--homocysteine methyltransferase
MALAEGVRPVEIMHSMRNGLVTAGRKYEKGEFFLSELIMAGIMAQEVSNILRPHLLKSSSETLGKVIIGTVEGDIHDA